jgi:dTDP-4-dehydrorhamnose reductase
MRVLITGGRGLLGHDLVPRLAREHIVFSADIDEFDIVDGRGTMSWVLRHEPEVIVHAAAYTQVDRAEEEREPAYRVNVAGTANVAAAANQIGAWLIYISTDFVFDGARDAPYHEEDLPNPLCHYGWTKLLGELVARERCDQLTIVRTAWLYGAGGHCFPRAILLKAFRGEPLRVVDDQVGCPTWSAHLAEAVAALIAARAYGLFHAVNAGGASWYEFARAVLDLGGFKDRECQPISSRELQRPARRPPQSRLDCSRLAMLTGYRPPPWREALAEFFQRHPQYAMSASSTERAPGGEE